MQIEFEECLLLFEREQSVPVIIRKPSYLDKPEWIYPQSHLFSLKDKCDIKVSTKTEKIQLLKVLLDLFIIRKISVPTVHAGFFFLYGTPITFTNENYIGEQLTEKKIGRKRLEALSKIPEVRVLDNDEFLAFQYQQMITENMYNPILTKTRLMFSPELFDKIFGIKHTVESLKWVEPISGERNLKSNLIDKDDQKI